MILLEYRADSSGRETAILTISRPENLNALNLQTLSELDAVLDKLAAHKKVRALIVTGAGSKAFVAGADVTELETLDTRGARGLSAEGSRVFAKLSGLPFPVIAAVNGFALGGGCELALACDIRLASENASFGLPEVTLGICPGWGGTQRLARLVGSGAASEMMFGGRRIDAARAFEIGLVNAVHPQDGLLDAAKEMAERIGKNAPLAVKATKKAMWKGLDVPLADGLEIEADEFSALFNSSDARNGLNAFNNREKYEFTGE